MYGEGDNFDLNSSHVLPALVKKFYLAKENNSKAVEVWGSGNVQREFLNVEDLAEAIFFVLKKQIKNDYINVGGGDHISIKKLALLIKKTVGYNGNLIFNKRYPDGVKKRKIDSSVCTRVLRAPRFCASVEFSSHRTGLESSKYHAQYSFHIKSYSA